MPSFAALCDLIVAPSEGLRQVLVDLGVRQEILVIPNGIDLQRFPGPRGRVSRESLGLPPSDPVLVYCGRLGPEKNLDFLLRAFRGALHAVPIAHLLLIGGGAEEEQLRDQVVGIPHVHLVGPVDYELVPSYLALGDMFVTASVTEVHPLSVIEGLAAGLPVLAISSPGISDTVRHGVDGYLCPHDLPAYTAMMVRSLLEPSRRQEMSSNARMQSGRFDIRTTASALMEQYERLILEAKKRPPKETLWSSLARDVQRVLGE